MGCTREAGASDTPGAVLYVCVQPSRHVVGLAERRAVEEGRCFAGIRRMPLVAEVFDPHDEPMPQKRAGWCRVRDMAARGETTSVITRWPNCISPHHELRYTEIDWLRQHGVRVLFSWPPLTAAGGADR